MNLSLAYLLIPLISRTHQTPQNVGYYMQPAIRGNTIVFLSQGDLYKVSAEGGVAHAITTHVSPQSHPAISPDGKTIAYTGSYEGSNDVYTLPIDGGLPNRLTYEARMIVKGWTSDGKVIASTNTHTTFDETRLVIIDPVTRKQFPTPLAQASEGDYDATGKTLFFTRLEFQGSYTKRYKGGSAQNLWKYTEGTPEAIPLSTDFTGTSKTPMYWKGRVYFLSDRDGTMNLWSMAENGKGLKQHTRYAGWDIQSASLDAGHVVYQLGADIHVFDLTKGTDQTLSITLDSDLEPMREKWIKNAPDYISFVKPSPNGDRVALTARGQVFVAPAEQGRFIEVTHKSSVRNRFARFTPDGKSIITLSDESGETEWWKLPANGVGTPEKLTKGTHVLTMSGEVSPDGKKIAYADKNFELWVYDIETKKTTKIATSAWDVIDAPTWSPDSQWLAYHLPTATFAPIYLYSVKTGVSTKITTDRYDNNSPAFSPDGKWLYFLSDRNFKSSVSSPWGPRQPEPYFDAQTKLFMIGLQKGLRSPFQPHDELEKPAEEPKPPTPPVPGQPATPPTPPKNEIDLDGIQNRLWEIPVPAGNYKSLTATATKLFLLSSPVDKMPSLMSLDIGNTEVALKPVAPMVMGYELTQDGSKLLLQTPGGLAFVPTAAPVPPKPVDLSGWTFSLKPQDEWRQMFLESWRLERDYFYDPKMHGVDWDSMLKKYLPLVDRVRSRPELSNLISQMVGELAALHIFVYGGDLPKALDAISVSFLGGTFTKDEAAGGYRVDKIYQGDPDFPTSLSPLAQPGVELSVGDIIQEINGISTLSAPDIGALLRNQTGKQVLLKVKDAKTGKSRDCITVPISATDLRNLRTTDWEISRRKIVEDQSKNTIGYVHLRAMGKDDIAQWAREFYPAFNRAGLIIDVRNNGGGNIDSWIIEKLLRKAWMYWSGRVGDSYWNMQYAFMGHVVVLCNEFTGSDGEAFTEGIKRLGIGKVIGTRTWGGEIWLSSSNFLNDGGIATAAEFGVYGPEGTWLVEGHGVDPDIIVDNLPHATYLGKDTQLDAAMAYLTKLIKDKPVVVPPVPKKPNKSFPVKSGR